MDPAGLATRNAPDRCKASVVPQKLRRTAVRRACFKKLRRHRLSAPDLNVVEIAVLTGDTQLYLGLGGVSDAGGL